MKCEKCGFDNPSNVHYCAKCGVGQGGNWKPYDASVFVVAERPKPNPQLQQIADEIAKLNADIASLEKSLHNKRLNQQNEVRHFKYLRDGLKNKFGNRMVAAYSDHLWYLKYHGWARNLEGAGMMVLALVLVTVLCVVVLKLFF